MTDLNLAGIRRLAKKGGAERITRKALVYLLQVSENFIIRISQEASKIAKTEGRKTINENDIRSALIKLKIIGYIEQKLEK